MNAVIAILDETDGLRSEELRWPLRLALVHGGDVTFVVPATGEAARSKNVDLRAGAEDDPLTQALGVPLRALLDQELAPEGWVEPRESNREDEAIERQEDAPISAGVEAALEAPCL